MSDIEDYLLDNLDVAKRIKHRSGDELILKECLYCGRSNKMYVNLGKLKFNCFAGSCQARGNIVALIQMVEGCGSHQATTIITGLLAGIVKARPLSELAEMFKALDEGSLGEDVGELSVPLPEGTMPLYNPDDDTYLVPRYCRERGITKRMMRRHHLGVCRSGRYRDRLIVPVETDGATAWVARDMTGEARTKYLNPGTLAGHFLWGYDKLQPNTPMHAMEGVFDAMRWDDHGLQSVAYFGSHLRGPQIQLLKRARPAPLILVPDGEAYGEVIGRASELLNHFDVIMAIRLEDGVDPDKVRRKRARQLSKDARRVRSHVDALQAQFETLRDPWE